MTTFKDFDDPTSVSTPVDLEDQAKSLIAKRVRMQRMVAAGLASVLIVAFAGVAFGVASNGNKGPVNSTDKGERQEISSVTSTTVDDSQDETESTEVEGTDDQSDESKTNANEIHGKPTTTCVSGSESHEVSRLHEQCDAHRSSDSSDDDSVTSTTAQGSDDLNDDSKSGSDSQESESSHSNSGSGNSGKGSDN